GVGLRWLDRGACDLVIAGGDDALSTLVASGVEALPATAASRGRPFRVRRDGLAPGGGGGRLAVGAGGGDVDGGAASGASSRPVHFRIAGFGASTDAVHITAPDRTGVGLARAATAALADAGLDPDDIGLVSAHGTATPFNDPMEQKAIHRA